jgi:putative cell wall-binding protein
MCIIIEFLRFTLQAVTSTERLAGSDRYATAIKISQEGWTTGASPNVVLAMGENFPDALAAAPLANQLEAPILLTEPNTLSNELLAELSRLGAQDIYIVGGEGVISKAIVNQLEEANFKVRRIAGTDRYETALEVAQFISSEFKEMSVSEAVVATGENFPDALSIAPIAASKGMPILLSPKDSLPDRVIAYLTEHKVTKTYVVGGVGAISETVMNRLPGAERLSGEDRYETNKAVLRTFDDDLNFDNVYAATGENYPDAPFAKAYLIIIFARLLSAA